MQGLIQPTSLFKNIFPNYNAFKDWWLEEDGNGYTNPFVSDENDVPSKKTFGLIFYRFMDCHVRFSDDNFKGQFAIDLYTYYKEFEETSKAIDNMMSLTSFDISKDDITIVNSADIPETTSSTDTTTVDYISTQNKTIMQKGSLRISRELLTTKRAYTVRTFLGRFNHLFVQVFSPYYNELYKDEEE